MSQNSGWIKCSLSTFHMLANDTKTMNLILAIYNQLLEEKEDQKSAIYYADCQIKDNFENLSFEDIQVYFKKGEKETLIDIDELKTYFSKDKDGKKRVLHVFSVYLLGIYCYDNIKKIRNAFESFIRNIRKNAGFNVQENNVLRRDFLYLWYLTVLFHDMGYAYESLGNSDDSHYSFVATRKSMNSKENLDCHNPILGIPEILRQSAKEYFYQRRESILFNENRCTDHGFAAGNILYKKLKELHEIKVSSEVSECKSPVGSSSLAFSPTIFQWYNIPSAWAIICHNMWLAEDGTGSADKYKQLGLEKLVVSRDNSPIKYDSHPLLFLLDFIDTIDFFKRLRCDFNMEGKVNCDCLKEIVVECSHNSICFRYDNQPGEQSNFVGILEDVFFKKIERDVSFLVSNNFTVNAGRNCITFTFL